MNMAKPSATWQIAQPREVRQAAGRWLRAARQRQNLTLPMLASASGVPVTTLHRLEREGQGGLDGFLRVLHALGLLDDFQSFISERLRLAELPTDLSELDRPVRVRRRVRVAKSTQGSP